MPHNSFSLTFLKQVDARNFSEGIPPYSSLFSLFKYAYSILCYAAMPTFVYSFVYFSSEYNVNHWKRNQIESLSSDHMMIYQSIQSARQD